MSLTGVKAFGWLGAVGAGVSARFRHALVEARFGQTGSIPDLYRHHGIDTNAIVAAAEGIAPGRSTVCAR